VFNFIYITEAFYTENPLFDNSLSLLVTWFLHMRSCYPVWSMLNWSMHICVCCTWWYNPEDKHLSCELWRIWNWVLQGFALCDFEFLVFKLCLLLDATSLPLWYMHLLYFLAIHHITAPPDHSCSTLDCHKKLRSDLWNLSKNRKLCSNSFVQKRLALGCGLTVLRVRFILSGSDTTCGKLDTKR
jgi:hypothetical protein